MRSFIQCAVGVLLSVSSIAFAQERAQPDIDFFAIGSSASMSRAHSKWIPQMVAIGVRDLRSFGGHWGGLEAEEGKFNFEQMEQKLEYLKGQGVRPGILLIGSPKWNTKDVQGGLPVNNLEGWSNYVFKVAEHFKGRVTYYEVWNEPPNGTKGAPPSDYAKIVTAAYTAAKKADPSCLVGLAAKSAHINYLDMVIASGAKDHFDYITLHPYEILGSITAHPGKEQIYMRIVPTVRKMLAARNPEKVNVPIIFTELGFDTKRGLDKQTLAVVKAYVMGAAQGIASIQWFEGMDGDSGPLGLMDAKGNLRPAHKAVGEMVRLIGQKPKYLGYLFLNDKHPAFVFQGPKSTVLATWGGTSASDSFDFGQSVKLVDPGTGKVTESSKIELNAVPILIDGVPEQIVKQAQANKDKPFPWGGDYTNEKSVSITFGEKNTEKGLHTMSSETIAADVVAYGGSARAGNVPGGNVYNVDANFLNYTSTPIEIAAVVRLNEKGEPAKLELEYESTNSYKKLPAVEIPDNKDWHTLKWRIDDSQFVGTWAFNFRFNRGNYLIQSVTVTKLDK